VLDARPTWKNQAPFLARTDLANVPYFAGSRLTCNAFWLGAGLQRLSCARVSMRARSAASSALSFSSREERVRRVSRLFQLRLDGDLKQCGLRRLHM